MSKLTSALVAASIALEEQLEALGSLAREAQQLPLDSYGNIRKTTQAMAEVGAMEEQLATRLHALMTAVDAISQRQQQQGEQLRARAEDLARRRDAHDALASRHGDLGRVASEINASMRRLVESQKRTPANQAHATAVMTAREIGNQLDALMATADNVHASAVSQGFKEFERQTHTLREQLSAARAHIDTHISHLKGAPN